MEGPYISHLIYLLEAEISKIKKEYRITEYNAEIFSARIAESFLQKREGLLGQYFHPPKPFNNTDYQYYLLIFLLFYFCESKGKRITQQEICNKFVDLHKNNSLTYVDIKISDLGSTRCKSGIKYAFQTLKNMGLLNQYAPGEKDKSWPLTYIGFVLAFSIIFDPDPNRPIQISEGMKPCTDLNIFGIDRWLSDRMVKLADEDYLHSILYEIYSNRLTDIEIQKGLEIFAEYRDFFEYIQRQNQKPRIRSSSVKLFVSEMVEKHLLDSIGRKLSKKFKSEAFLKRIGEILEY
jgi:hypothetical protein